MTRIAVLLGACLLASCAPAEDTGLGARGSAKTPCYDGGGSNRSWEANAKCESPWGGGGSCTPQPEIMGDGVDQDCDGSDNCYEDLDNDGWGTSVLLQTNNGCNHNGKSDVSGDCQDNTACGGTDYYPGNPKGQACGSGEDYDCDPGTCGQDTNCGCGMCVN